MRTMLAAVTQIQTVQGYMDQKQIYTLITSIKGKYTVLKAPPVYARNPDQVYANSIIDCSISVVAKIYRYATAAI